MNSLAIKPVPGSIAVERERDTNKKYAFTSGATLVKETQNPNVNLSQTAVIQSENRHSKAETVSI